MSDINNLNLTPLITAAQNTTIAINNLTHVLSNASFQITGTSATAGALVGYISIVLPDGSAAMIPYYAP